jgi:hypothetical protein
MRAAMADWTKEEERPFAESLLLLFSIYFTVY